MLASYESLVSQLAPVAAGASYNTSVTLTDVSPTVSRAVLPAHFLKAGSALKITAWGTFANSATTPTLLIGAYYGGVAGVALAAATFTTVNTATISWPWRLEIYTIIRSDGASGTAMSHGSLFAATSLTAQSVIPAPATALATVTVDTTAQKEITIGAQWGASAAANILVCQGFLVESIA